MFIYEFIFKLRIYPSVVIDNIDVEVIKKRMHQLIYDFALPLCNIAC
jgi:hypothetical protein